MFMCVFVALLMFLQGDSTKKKEPKIDPLQALKTIVSEADKRYKASIREYRSAKTSADRDDLVDKHRSEFIEWALTKERMTVEFDSVVTNVIRLDSGVYAAIVSAPRELLPFNAAMKKPLISRTQLSFDLTDQERETITSGDKVRVKGKLSPELVVPDDRSTRQSTSNLIASDPDVLLWLKCDFGTLSSGLAEQEFKSPYLKMTLVDVFFEVTESRKDR